MSLHILDSDRAVMEKNNWSVSFVTETLNEYALEYGISFKEAEQIFNFFGVNELFDGIPLACEELAEVFY